MAKLTSNYPHGLSDREIKECIDGYSKEIFDNRNDLTSALVQYAPLIQLGQVELQGRRTKRVTYLSIGVNIFSLVIASFALFVSYNSSRLSTSWESKQLELIGVNKQRY